MTKSSPAEADEWRDPLALAPELTDRSIVATLGSMAPRSRRLLPLLAVVLVAVLAVEIGLLVAANPGLLGGAAIASPSPTDPGPTGLETSPGPSAIEVGQEASGLPEDPSVVEAPPAAIVTKPLPPLGGTELYGYLPYWQMSSSMVDHLRDVPLTTMALFSVGAADDGSLDITELGYRRITGSIGAQLITAAKARHMGVELVFTSFGLAQNHRLFGRPGLAGLSDEMPGSGADGGADRVSPMGGLRRSGPATPRPPLWSQTVPQLVALAVSLKLDGINVDVELLDGDDFDGYTAFLIELRRELLAALPKARLTVASTASHHGAVQARAATIAGVDRIFLMGYDYHWSGSQPGGSAPLARTDGITNLPWSIGQYAAEGVPADRTLLGLPLYGMSWPVNGSGKNAPSIGKGVAWIPANHTDVLLDPLFVPARDRLQLAEYFVTPDADGVWHATFFDSPDTLRPKLALARDRGFAGAGFWAIGYEQGVPGYTELMRDFRSGQVGRAQLYELAAPFGR